MKNFSLGWNTNHLVSYKTTLLRMLTLSFQARQKFGLDYTRLFADFSAEDFLQNPPKWPFRAFALRRFAVLLRWYFAPHQLVWDQIFVDS